jgi:mono/diheme cytochrome c family protein/heme/copper-type cytochrome/quinol oxidase subunit 4
MSHDHKGSSVGMYTFIALVLGVITYIEFAIIQYEVAWLNATWTVITLIVLSLGKFVLVVAFFMHLKDDERTYTGFFSIGMVFALGTFVALAFLFSIRSVSAVWARSEQTPVEVQASGEHPEEAKPHHELHGVPEHLQASIESEGYSRPLAEIFDAARPKNQALSIAVPVARTTQSFTVSEAPPLFAFVGQDSVPVEEIPATEVSAQTDAAQGFDTELGGRVYASNCAGCHQANGQGIPGAFPPLAGHLPTLYQTDSGREYLVNTLLYGLQGQIEALGQSYNGVMPAWAQLGDDEIAAVLNHGLGEFTPILAEEVAAARGTTLSGAQVLELRNALELP